MEHIEAVAKAICREELLTRDSYGDTIDVAINMGWCEYVPHAQKAIMASQEWMVSQGWLFGKPTLVSSSGEGVTAGWTGVLIDAGEEG